MARFWNLGWSNWPRTGAAQDFFADRVAGAARRFVPGAKCGNGCARKCANPASPAAARPAPILGRVASGAGQTELKVQMYPHLAAEGSFT